MVRLNHARECFNKYTLFTDFTTPLQFHWYMGTWLQNRLQHMKNSSNLYGRKYEKSQNTLYRTLSTPQSKPVKRYLWQPNWMDVFSIWLKAYGGECKPLGATTPANHDQFWKGKPTWNLSNFQSKFSPSAVFLLAQKKIYNICGARRQRPVWHPSVLGNAFQKIQ